MTPLLKQLFDKNSSTFTYLIGSNAEALIVDPVKENVPQYLQLLTELGLSLKMVLDTHVHADHITGSGLLQQLTQCEVGSPQESAACCGSFEFKDQDVLTLGKLEIRCLFTPGHTDDSYCFYVENPGWLFTGDTLFIRGTGRTDFQNGSAANLYESLHQKILTLPQATVVYPGHDYKGMSSSTILEERNHNPRVLIKNKDAFIEHMNNLKLADPKMMDIAVPANLKLGL
ncbi:MAG: MBL fold metallo-hydrolase [Gammaproteobacteria bacterium]